MKIRDDGEDATRLVPRRTQIHACPFLQTNVRWPAPIDQRLNELLSILAEAGADTTRSQLVAALVSEAPTAPRALLAILTRYGEKTAGGVVLQARGPIELESRNPGRRPRR